VADYAALANVGGVVLVRLNGASLAIVRTGQGAFVALSRVCPHQGGTINTTAGGFICSRHGARFDATGMWIGGERTSSMRAYTTQYDATTGTLVIG
jgi:Rieske Fe-S protein